MTQPPSPRSSLAIALQDYRGIRPGIAITVAAVALVAAVVVGIVHIVMLRNAREAIEDGRQTMETLHTYNAALEVWRQIAAMPESERTFPQQLRLRDSISVALRQNLGELQEEIDDPVDRELVGDILGDLEEASAATGTEGTELGVRGREAMIVLTARQDSVLFRAAARSQQSQLLAAFIIGLAVVAAGILIVPMSWMYVRYKRGIPPGF